MKRKTRLRIFGLTGKRCGGMLIVDDATVISTRRERNFAMAPDTEHFDQDTDRALVESEVVALFGSENIVHAIKTYRADTKQKEISLEFVKSYLQFINEIAAHDAVSNRDRSDPEVRDLVSHVNLMLRKRDEDVFTSMVLHCNRHYRQIIKGGARKAAE